MSTSTKHIGHNGRLIMVGFGSIGQGVLPLILRHMDIQPQQITIVTADTRGADEAHFYGIKRVLEPLTPENYRTVLDPLVRSGDFILNLSVDVSCMALIEFAHQKGALYLDTVIEPWAGFYTDPHLTPSQRSNYALREQMLALRARLPKGGPTAVITHGANPGLVSHFVKRGLLNIAADTGVKVQKPRSREEWAALAQRLNVKVMHVAERDTQVANIPKRPGEFVNTWSIEGFYSEGCQPAELGWGSHERHIPHDGEHHTFGRGSAIFLDRPGASTRVRTWTPNEGPFLGFLVTHGEAISLSDYFTVRDGERVAYRPTVHYAYHPCDDAVLSVHELAGKNWTLQNTQRLLMDEIIDGIDELGMLLAGHAKGAYWYGSQLSVEEARRLVPYNNATSLQVTISVLAGMVWAMENPGRGIVEPEEMDFERVLDICTPYLGPVVGKYTEWNPLQGRGVLFPEDLDHDDPWQFKNIRVV